MLPTIDDLSPERIHNLAAFITIRDELMLLEKVASSEDENKKESPIVVEINRRLVVALLEMTESPIVRKDLEYTELEVARLKKMHSDSKGFLTESMRFKLKIYVCNFLRENLGI